MIPKIWRLKNVQGEQKTEFTIPEESLDDRLEHTPSRWVLASGQNEVVPDGIKKDLSPLVEGVIEVLTNNNREKIRFTEFANAVIDRVSRKFSPNTSIWPPQKNQT